MADAQATLSNSSEISLITCRPGDQLYNTFGHTAIRVFDPEKEINHYFNYGLFDFRTPNFYSKFLRGKLLYQLGIQNENNFLNEYAYAKRSVFEQKLNLDSVERQQLFDDLMINYQPRNRKYLYDFFFDNCSTRPRDVILENISQVTFDESSDNLPTFRELLDRHTFSSPWIDFGIDLIIGSVADRKADAMAQMFLPELLFSHFAKAKKGEEALVSSETIVLNFENQIARRSEVPKFSPTLFFGLLTLLELFFLLYTTRSSKIVTGLEVYDKLLFMVLGIGSLIILFMWFGTDHIATKNNLNALWMHPVFLIIPFIRNRQLWLLSAILALLALLLSPFIQELHIASILLIVIIQLKLARWLLAIKKTAIAT